MRTENEDYQYRARKVVGAALHAVSCVPNVKDAQITEFKSTLWPLVDEWFDKDDYWLDESYDGVVGGVSSIMDLFDFSRAQKIFVNKKIYEAVSLHFGDGGGNR